MKKHTASHIGAMYENGEYAAQNQTWHIEESPWKAGHVHTILQKNGITFNTMAEIGCGAGEILNQLSKSYPHAHFTGYDISPQAIKLAQPRAHERLTFHKKDLTEEAVTFDTLLCMDVFEHVENDIHFLKALHSKATYKVFHIPLDLNVSTILRAKPIQTVRDTLGHLHYYTRETALETLKYCGYEILDECYGQAYWDLPASSVAGKIAKYIRKIFFSLAPHLTVRCIGGCTLVVLAK